MQWTHFLIAAAVAGGPHSLPGTAAPAGSPPPMPLMGLLADELRYSMEKLVNDDGLRPYYLAYTVNEQRIAVLSASLGALVRDSDDHSRRLSIDVRVGDYQLDNTHQIRGAGPGRAYGGGAAALPLTDEADAIRHILWLRTDKAFKRAAQRLLQVKTNLKVKVEEEDKSDDFSKEVPNVFAEAPARLVLDKKLWADRLRKISATARDHPLIYQSSITLGTLAGTRTMASSEGTRLQTAQTRYRVTISASTKAEDGMDIGQNFDFNAATPDKLPSVERISAAFKRVMDQVLALRAAPLAEPYTGPAILRNRASAVFFHEIFGHRIEGHRQKDVTEGQTFTKRIGKPVLPEFISVFDDPTRRRFGDIDLRGYYLFDDEGVPGTNVTLVDKGILKTFLLSRSPVKGFPKSNGHGRCDPGLAVVSRQANLMVESSKHVPFNRLRELLIEECKQQGKPYGLLFEDISGGFTTTSRRGPQAFKVLPIVVYKLYVDGRADELIRGVDIVGTPLSCFERITWTGDDSEVFNGTCGAESGWVPVSAISPSILVTAIEIEKRHLQQSRPPILDPPRQQAKPNAEPAP